MGFDIRMPIGMLFYAVRDFADHVWRGHARKTRCMRNIRWA